MRSQTLSIVIFVISFISLFISLKLFYNLAIFSDEFGTSPSVVNGSDFWLMMDWLRMFLLFVLCLVSGISILNNMTKKS